MPHLKLSPLGPKAVHGGRLFPVTNFSGRALQRDRILHRAFQWQHGLFQGTYTCTFQLINDIFLRIALHVARLQ